MGGRGAGAGLDLKQPWEQQGAGSITWGEESLPFAADIELDPASSLAAMSVTPLDEATRATVELFRKARAEGLLVPAEHGLPLE